MDFNHWQLDRLRRGLNAYRLTKKTGRAPLSWRTVLDHILCSEKTLHDPPPDDEDEGPFKQEALRRFAKGQETLQQDKLEDVWLFLIEKGMLGRDELEQTDDFKEALALHVVLASSSPQGRNVMSSLMAAYSVVNIGSHETEHIELRFHPQTTENLVAVEERVRIVSTQRNFPSKGGGRVAAITRRGYAFTSSKNGTLHIFLRGGSPDDHVHYVSVTAPRGAGLNPLLQPLLRSGPPERIFYSPGDPLAAFLLKRGMQVAPLVASDEQVRQVLEFSNILSFTPTDERRVYAAPAPAPLPGPPYYWLEPPESDATVLGSQLITATRERSPLQIANAIADGADVTVRDEHGMTALHHAAAHGMRPCIRVLVASGKCDFLARDNQGRYAFELAIEWARDYAVARLLMKKQVQQAAAQGVPAYVPRGS